MSGRQASLQSAFVRRSLQESTSTAKVFAQKDSAGIKHKYEHAGKNIGGQLQYSFLEDGFKPQT